MKMSELFKRSVEKKHKKQFSTYKQLDDLIIEYLSQCDDNPSKIGLNTHLGITRQNVYDWANGTNEKSKRFSYTIKRAYDIMEQQLVANLSTKHTLANMFKLKATFKYQDNHKPTIVSTSHAPIIKITTNNTGDNKI